MSGDGTQDPAGLEGSAVFEADDEYLEFIRKFNRSGHKMTTDDCYTPPAVYDAVLRYVGSKVDLSGASIERPFRPGGDYERYPYRPESVVIDNPPFSIERKIVRFYLEHGIRFFLFTPGLFSIGPELGGKVAVVTVARSIVYHNGATVPTGFVTNLLPPGIILSGELDASLRAAQLRGGARVKKSSADLGRGVTTLARLKKFVGPGEIVLRVGEDIQSIGGHDTGAYGGSIKLTESGMAKVRGAAPDANDVPSSDGYAIEYLAPTELSACSENARVHGRSQLDALRSSILRFGFRNPILADERLEVIAGHGRLEAALELGLDSVPVIRIRGLTDAQKRGLRVSDNRLAELGGWDVELLGETLDRLRAEDFPLDCLGFGGLPDDVLAMTDRSSVAGLQVPSRRRARWRFGSSVRNGFGIDAEAVRSSPGFVDASELSSVAEAGPLGFFLSASRAVFDVDGIREAYEGGGDAVRFFIESTGLVDLFWKGGV